MKSPDQLDSHPSSPKITTEKQKRYFKYQRILNWVNTLLVFGASFMPVAPVTAQEIKSALSPEECAARGYIDPADWAYIFGESAESITASSLYTDPTQVFGLELTEADKGAPISTTERNWALDDLGVPEGGLILDPPKIITETQAITDSMGVTSTVEVTRPDFITIAVIDSGSKPELAPFVDIFNDRVAFEYYDVLDDDCDTNAEHYHGVFMLGIIASNNADISVVKYDQDTDPSKIPFRILVIRLLDKNSGASWTNLFKALVIAKNSNADFASLSLGTKNPNEALKAQLTRAVDLLRYNGTEVVVAAGNNPYADDFLPACLSNLIRVGATDIDDELFVLGNTACNELPKGTVVAPGVGVLGYDLDGSIVSKSGTSMATPYVTLLLALYANRYGRKYAWPAMQANLRTNANNPDFGLGEIDYSTNNPPILPAEPDLGPLPTPVPLKKTYLPTVLR